MMNTVGIYAFSQSHGSELGALSWHGAALCARCARAGHRVDTARQRNRLAAQREQLPSTDRAKGRLKLPGLPELDIRGAIIASEIMEPGWKRY